MGQVSFDLQVEPRKLRFRLLLIQRVVLSTYHLTPEIRLALRREK